MWINKPRTDQLIRTRFGIEEYPIGCRYSTTMFKINLYKLDRLKTVVSVGG